MIDNLDLIFYTVFGILTISLSSVVALVFIKSQELRQHPSGLIMSIAICEVIMSYHSIIFAWGSRNYVSKLALDLSLVSFGIGRDKSNHMICGSNQVILSAATVACICYNITICVDLIVTLFNPLIPGHVRKNWYHGIIAVTVVYFTIFINVRNKFIQDCESNQANKLEILNSASVGILLVIYLCFAVVSIFYSAYRFATGLKLEIKKTREYLIRHVLYVSIFILCWVCPAISYLMKNNKSHHFSSTKLIDTIAIATTSISGFLLGIVRLSENSVRSKLVALFRKQEEDQGACDAWTQPVSVIVQSKLNQELALCVFEGLHKAYSGHRNDHIDLDDMPDAEFRRRSTKTVLMEKNKKDMWGVNDINIKGMIVNMFASEVFLGVMQKFGWSVDQILNSLCPSHNANVCVGQSSGKSGSFFLSTSDQKLSIKTISRSERKLMMRFLKDYATHVNTYERTLLCRIFGVFSINVPGITIIDIILMENVFQGPRPSLVYDIKGSTSGRTSIKKGEVKGPFKDKDFISHQAHLLLSDENVQLLKFQISKDVILLKRHKLMDYSLLIGVSKSDLDQDKLPKNCFRSIGNDNLDTVYTLGIIDFLTEYGILKSFERNWAALKFGKKVKQVSVANPASYSNRFYNFIFSVVFKVMNRNSSYKINED